jgi:hypothetical protein
MYTKDLFMSFDTIFWDIILGHYFGTLFWDDITSFLEDIRIFWDEN